jgi:hypothetical protein
MRKIVNFSVFVCFFAICACSRPAPTDIGITTLPPTAVPVAVVTTDNTPLPTEPPATPPPPTPSPEPTPFWDGLIDARFSDLFLPDDDEPILTETTYQSSSIYISLSYYDSPHLKYWVADVYIRKLENLHSNYVTKFEKSKYLPKLHSESSAILTINTDYWVIPNGKKRGWFVKNGDELGRFSESRLNFDFCVIYNDGRMETYDYKAFLKDFEAGSNSFAALAENKPYQVFNFGPALLDDESHAKVKFNSSVPDRNPRTAIGYYEPGHYAFICILGGRDSKDVNGKLISPRSSYGMTLIELSQLCESLGLTSAYNLDGGGSSAMMFMDKLYGHNDRPISDALSIVELPVG